MRWRRRSLLQTIVSWLRAWNGPPAVQQRIAPVSASVMRPAARCGRCSNRSKGGRPFNPQANEQKRSANRDLGEPSLHCGRGRIIGEPTAYPPAKGPARPSKGEKFKKQKKMVRFVVDRCPALPCPALPIAGMAAPVWCKWADSRGPPRCPIRQRLGRRGETRRGAARDEGRGPCSVTDFGSRCREGAKRRERSLSENPGVWSVLSKTCIRAPIHRHPGTASKRLAGSERQGGRGARGGGDERREMGGKLEPVDNVNAHPGRTRHRNMQKHPISADQMASSRLVLAEYIGHGVVQKA